MLRLVSFDLDGTLIHPAIFNAVAEPLGFGDKLEETTRLYFEGRMTAEETFHADHKHFVGRRVDEMRAVLQESPAWTPHIKDAIDALHEKGLKVVVTTDQPDYLARITEDLFGVDDVICTPVEVKHGRVTSVYHGEFHKWPNLQRYLKAKRIPPTEVAHVGNGTNDVPIFQNVALGIAVNAMSEEVRKGARLDLGRVRDMRKVATAILAEG